MKPVALIRSSENNTETLSNDNSTVDSVQPSVYFRGINRVHINRFKAYILILANRLSTPWLITDDITSANIVVEMVPFKNQQKQVMQMSVLAGTANLKPPVLMSFKLVFNDKKMIQQLNQASRVLSQVQENQSNRPEKLIKISATSVELMNQLCNSLNQKSHTIRFVPNDKVSSNYDELYRDHLLLIVDGRDEASVVAYQTLIDKKINASIIIDQLTVAVIKTQDETLNDEVFDMVYAHSDDHTQVTLLDIDNDKELEFFASYF